MYQKDRPIANPIVVLREEFDDWAILFNPDTAAAVGINPVGVAVWKRMDGMRSLQDIVKGIKADFEDVSEAAIEEITAFVDKLAEQGYVGYELKATTDDRLPEGQD
ncbi:MAG: SynChlorMet cassette protein ScmD [Anaerolineae bacterium]